MGKARPVGRQQAYLALDIMDRLCGRAIHPQSAEWDVKHQACECLKQALANGVVDEGRQQLVCKGFQFEGFEEDG